jgi:acyl-CoA thioesterase I
MRNEIFRHSRESGHLGSAPRMCPWTPACAGPAIPAKRRALSIRQFAQRSTVRHAGLLRCGALSICAWLCVMSGLLLREAAAAGPMVILVLGDSFTAGLGVPREAAFPAQLGERLRENWKAVQVVNAGVSGDTTAGGLARLDLALVEKPDLVILELGANDALRGIPPDLVRANLDAIIRKIQASGAKLLLTGMRAPPNWGENYRAAFDRIYPDLARIRGVPLYPFFLQGVALDPELNQPDRLHPNERGVHVLVDRIAPVLEHLTKDQGTGGIPVATNKGIVWMGEEEYREFSRGLGNLPVLSGSYVFGSTIPRPSTNAEGHIHVSDRTEPTVPLSDEQAD